MRIVFSLALVALAFTPALAAPTARVSGGNVAVRSGPGMGYGIIGRIPNGTEVSLDYCTRNDRWCLVTDSGWVDASWLVGWSAKIQATPPDFMGPGW
ncbi:SH3 domain-containing protein [Devosia crocina]|uniref:SH3 domain-containing protein n=1 Tax=Devosia crocina TaxID=429728 RepID=A0A1I7N5G8_9HYPH|nr:SH3 domain-containing protein [Devosia crocina]SFV29816.1 SH3 domain-containing protein [Devosia crocina]